MNDSHQRSTWQILAFSLISCSLAYANPSGPIVEHGIAQFENIDAKTLAITTSDKAIINWNDFSIAEGELTQFFQPSSKSIVVNQVTGDLSSFLLGTLKANGNVFLLNSNGILIGESGCVDTNSFIASTLPVCCSYALLDGESEAFFEGDSTSSIINFGRIKAWDGDVALISYQIENNGVIDAFNGTVALAAGQEVILQPLGSERIAVRPSQARYENNDTGIDNSGWISACKAELKADGNAYGLAIRHAGFIDALGLAENNGEVFLVAENGNNGVFGAIAAENVDGTGGNVQILGQHITLYQNANIDASGDNGGGMILVGGDQSGANPTIANALTTFIEEGATLYADALENGNGGTVIVWADGATTYYGEISARGGDQSGDGGFVEVSGKQNLDFRGEVDTRAPFGMFGTLLLDPTDISIVSGSTDMNVLVSPGPIYSPSASPSQLSDNTLTTALGANNVIVQSTSTGGGTTGAITLTSGAGFTWSANTNLTLNTAGIGVTNGDITIAAGSGGITNTGSGTITLTAVTNINLFDTLSVGTGNVVMSSGGNTTITGTTVQNGSGNIMLQSAGFLHINGSGPIAGLVGETCSVVVNGDINIVSTTGQAEIDMGSTCSVTSNTGNINVTAGGQPAFISGGPVTLSAPLGSVTVKSGSGTGSIGSISSAGGSLIITAGKEVILDSTLGPNNTVQAFISSFAGLTTTINAGSLIMTAGSFADAFIESSDAVNITLTGASAGGLTMTAGAGGDAIIDATPSGAITITAPNSNMVMTGPVSGTGIAEVITSEAPINITVNSLTMTGNATTSLIQTQNNDMIITANQAITLNPTSTIEILAGTMQISHPMLIIAGTNIYISPGSIIDHNGEGPVTLVVDNLFPVTGTYGNGSFINLGAVGANSLPLQIYTSRRQLNTITGTLHSSTYIPGPYLVTTATEEWFVWYPNGIGGLPDYKIFYKVPDIFPPPPPTTPSVQLALTLFNQAAYEFLQDLEDYDFFWYWKTLFTSNYDHTAYAQNRRDDQLLSSDVIGKTNYRLLRKEYKENNGKIVNLLK